MAKFPLDPMLAKMVIASEAYKVGGTCFCCWAVGLLVSTGLVSTGWASLLGDAGSKHSQPGSCISCWMMTLESRWRMTASLHVLCTSGWLF